MIIVSQDKDEIVNFDSIASMIINDVWDDKPGQVIKVYSIPGHEHTIGYYKNEERAKQVLEDMHRVYGLSELYKYSTEEEREAIMDGLSQVDQFPFKYEMPKE